MNTVKRVLIPCVLGFLLFLASAVFAQSDPLTSLPGRIAYISTDYNVHTFNFAQQQTHELTQDGSNSTRYQWVTWSFDGRLAYFCCDLQAAQSLDTSAHISPDGIQPGKVVFSEYAAPVVYAAWSPRLCADSEGCLDLAMLVNDAQSGGFRIELVRDSGASESRMSVSNGAPFFYSWSHDGAQMVFHRNGNTLDVYDVAGAALTTAEVAAPSTFQAPAWSPIDDRILSAIRGAERGKTSLIVTAQGESQTLIPDMSGVVSFSWSPDGRYIAYRIINDQLFGAVFVVDAVSGQVVSRSSTSGVIAFFWSPDSRKLAYVTFEQAGALNSASAQSSPFIDTNPAMVQDIEGLMWSTLDIETGLNRSYSSFVPTTELVYLFLYFDQFAQSHRIWSPDSSHIVYTELTRSDGAFKSQVSVLNVTQPNSTPLQVAEGVFAVWSFD